jgi:hypothetical protein
VKTAKKEFKRLMQQGLVRCNIVLQKSEKIEKYKDVVLWGCLHNLGFDIDECRFDSNDDISSCVNRWFKDK